MSETKAAPKTEAKPEPKKPEPETKAAPKTEGSFSPDEFKQAREQYVPTSLESLNVWRRMVDRARLAGYSFRGGDAGKIAECALVKDGKTVVDALVEPAPAKDGKK